MVSVLIACDKFKGSLTALEVGNAVAAGIRRVCADAYVDVLPVADGGDGTVAAAVAAGYVSVPVNATGPTGEPVVTSYARRDGDAVVEMADVSGLARLPAGRLSPMTATSRGTGEVIAAAVNAGCRRIVLGIGGSASTDGGAGLLQALGARLVDQAGEGLRGGGGSLSALEAVDFASLRARMGGIEFTVACDVDNPLTGSHGAAAVYGPQKGADSATVETLDAGLAHWADLVAAASGTDHRDKPGAGAAGGVGFAAIAVLDAELRPGIELVLDLVGFHERAGTADLVVTGEGALDRQTLRGKAPAGVAAAARATGTPVVAVCGHNTLEADQLTAAGITAAYALTDLEPDLQRCMDDGVRLLGELGEHLALAHLSQRGGGA